MRSFVVLLLSISTLLVISSCGNDSLDFDCPEEGEDYYQADTAIGDLYEFCFGGGEEDCRSSQLELLLYYDPVNSWVTDQTELRLQSVSGPGGQLDGVKVFCDGPLPSETFGSIPDTLGWKVRISDAGIAFCEECYTQCGLAKIIHLNCHADSLAFVHDPDDSLGVYINYSQSP